MKKINFKKIGMSILTSFAACLIFGANAYSVVASAEEAKDINVVTIDVTVKETQDVYSIDFAQDENGECVVSCEADESFVYAVNHEDGVTTVDCSGLLEQDVWTYEMTYVIYAGAEDKNAETVLSVTKGADVVEVKISLSAVIVDYDAYVEDEQKSEVSTTLSNDGKTLTVFPSENNAVAASDVVTVRIIIPDMTLVGQLEDALNKAASTFLVPEVYLIVAAVLLVILAGLGIAIIVL